ncbi:hypothetical protein J6590_082888 [Homalodisca vitripennis]|nr:hypothetical protein J6590_082888 [Homalodisca vitripennis]
MLREVDVSGEHAASHRTRTLSVAGAVTAMSWGGAGASGRYSPPPSPPPHRHNPFTLAGCGPTPLSTNKSVMVPPL